MQGNEAQSADIPDNLSGVGDIGAEADSVKPPGSDSILAEGVDGLDLQDPGNDADIQEEVSDEGDKGGKVTEEVDGSREETEEEEKVE
jgi:hypothetical protein